MKVAISTSSFAKFSDTPLRLLRERGFEVVLNPHGRALTEEEAMTLLQGCVGIAAGTEPLTARVMEACPELRVISRCGVGMDSVDMEAAKARGILVRNTPDGPTRAVAELTLGYALDLMRQVSRMDREMRAGQWQKRMGNLLHGKTLGIVGFGRIGRAVAGLFAAMGCSLCFYDPLVSEDCGDCRSLGLYELLSRADIVTLHTAKPRDGSLILDAEGIARMKKGAWLINAARGGIIDEQALYDALKSGALSGAALDVYAKEPYNGPLLELPQVIFTPHAGSYAKEARITMETDTIKNLLDGLEQQNLL